MKTKIKNRVLAILMAFVMVFGVAEGFLVRAEGTTSEVTPIDMTVSTFGKVDSNVSNTAYIYFHGNDVKNVPSEAANIKGQGVFSAADAQSGVWLGETKLAEGIGVAYTSDGYWRIGNGTALGAEEGSILTVKGTFSKTISNTLYKIIMPELQIQYTGGKWVKCFDLRDYTFSVREGATLVITKDVLHLSVSSSQLNSLVGYANAFVAADNNSGIWTGTTGDVTQDTRRSELEFRKTDLGYCYRIGSATKSINATEGMYLTIKGTFTADSINIVLPEMKFQYTAAGWVRCVLPTTIDMTGATFALNNNSNATFIYTEVTNAAGNAIKVKGQGVFSAADEQSGVWLGENKLDASVGVAYTNDGYWRIGVSGTEFGAVEGSVLTVKGTFEKTLSDGTYEIIMPELKFEYTAAGWVKYVSTVTVDMTAACFTLNRNSNKTYVFTEVTNMAENAASVKGQGVFSAANAESGVWLGETKLDASVGVAYTSDGYWRIGNGTEFGAVEGSVLTVKGTFAKTLSDGTYEIIMPELKFEYTATGWVKYVSTVTVDMTAASFTLNRNSGKTYVFTEVTNMAENAASVKGQGVFSAADEQSGVWLGETKLDASVGVAYTSDGYWRIGNGTAFGAEEGSVLTAKGSFIKTIGDVNCKIIIPEMKFEYTGTIWIKYLPTVTVDVREVTFALNVNSNPSYIFMEAKNIPENAASVKGQGVFSAADTASGVWLGETKLAEGIGFAYTSDGYWRIGNGTAFGAEAGSVLTAKGSFIKTIGDVNYKIIIPEMKFEYTITGWVQEIVLDPDVTVNYKTTKIESIHTGVPPVVNANGRWAFYVLPSATGLGEPWKDKYNNVKIQVGNQTIKTTLSVAFEADGLYFTLPTSVLPEKIATDTAITIKAGKYIMLGDTTKGMNLTEDFTIYANKYGFSTTGFMKEVVPSQKGAVVEIDRTAAYGGNENGIYLTTNDIFPVDKEWKARIRAVSYDDNSGVFYNGVKLPNADIARYLDGKMYLSLARGGVTAQDKDKVTIKGLFALGELGVTYAEASFYWNGQAWNTTYEPPKPETYTKIQGLSIHSVSNYRKSEDKWVIYVKVDNMLPGAPDKIRFSSLTAIVNGKKLVVSPSHSHEHTLCFSIPGEYLPEVSKDGIKITLKAGKALAPDKVTGIELTKDFVFYTFRGALTEQTVTKNTVWQELKVSRMYRTTKFSETQKRWAFHLQTTEKIKTPQGTQFYQLPIQINGKTHLVNASIDGGFVYVKIPEEYLSGTTKKATITIQAGAEAVGNAGRDGIRFKEDWNGYIYNGVLSDEEFDEVVRTEVNILGIQTVLNQATSYGVYLRVNREVPGTPWYEYYDDFSYYYNGRKIAGNIVKSISSNSKYIYFSISKEEVPEPKEGDIVEVKAGTEVNCGGYQIAILNGLKMCYTDGVWSAFMETDVTEPKVIGKFWEEYRFDNGYIPATKDGTVLFAGTDEFKTISTIDSHMDYTMKFKIKKSIAEEQSAPFRVILRGNPISEDEPMSPSLLNGYVLTFVPNKVTDEETEKVHYGCTMNLWKNGENTSLQDQYRLSYVQDRSEHPFFENDVYYDYEISVYNLTETCVCIVVKVNDKLIMRYYDEAGSDPFDPAINAGKFCIMAIAPATIDEEIVELDTVISEMDECKVGQKIRVAATYPSIIEGAEFTVDSKDAKVTEGLFVADKAGTYTVSCTYNGKQLKSKVITVTETEMTSDDASETTFPIIPIIISAVTVVLVAAMGTIVFVKKRKKGNE